MTIKQIKAVKDLRKVIRYDLEALKDFRDSKKTFNYHFRLLKGNLIDLYKIIKSRQ